MLFVATAIYLSLGIVYFAIYLGMLNYTGLREYEGWIYHFKVVLLWPYYFYYFCGGFFKGFKGANDPEYNKKLKEEIEALQKESMERRASSFVCPACRSLDVKIVCNWDGTFCDLECFGCGQKWIAKLLPEERVNLPKARGKINA